MEQPDPEQPPRLVWFHPEHVDAAVIDVDDVMMSIEERTEDADLAGLSEQAITDLCQAISRASHDRAEAASCRAALAATGPRPDPEPTTPCADDVEALLAERDTLAAALRSIEADLTAAGRSGPAIVGAADRSLGAARDALAGSGEKPA